MARITLTFLVVLYLLLLAQSRTFEVCELARELKHHGFPFHEIPDWMCLVEHESSRRTHVVGGPNWDGSFDHGLFQINDRYWCNNNDQPGKGCNVRCQELRSDNIETAVRCTKEIFKYHGFHAWVAWKDRCRGRPLPTIQDCGL